jgi:hypothetical protein
LVSREMEDGGDWNEVVMLSRSVGRVRDEKEGALKTFDTRTTTALVL